VQQLRDFNMFRTFAQPNRSFISIQCYQRKPRC